MPNSPPAEPDEHHVYSYPHGDGKKDGGQIHWIQKMHMKKGAETEAAKRAGMSTHAYMEKHKHDSGKSGNRARVGLRLSAMSKHKD